MFRRLAPVVIAAASFQAGSPVVIPLAADGRLKSVIVECAAVVNNGGARTIFEDGLARSHTFRLFFWRDSPNWSLDGKMLRRFNRLTSQNVGDAYTEVAGGAGAGTGSFAFVFNIADPRLSDPMATAVDLALAAQPRLEIVPQGPTGWGNGVVGDLVSLTYTVTLEYEPRTGQPVAGIERQVWQYADVLAGDLPAGSNARAITWDKGFFLRRQMFAVSETTSATRPLVDGLLTTWEYVVGELRAGIVSAAAVRALNRVEKLCAPDAGLFMLEEDEQNVLDNLNLTGLAAASLFQTEFSTASAYANGFVLQTLDERLLPPPIVA